MAQQPKMAVHLTEDELRFLISVMQAVHGKVASDKERMRSDLERLFESALDFSTDPSK